MLFGIAKVGPFLYINHRINSALKVIQCCIDCLKEHYDITIEPIADNPDSLHSFLFNCLILETEVGSVLCLPLDSLQIIFI